MATLTCLHRLPQELKDMVWDQALLEEVESRFVLVHRASMKVVPHKNTTPSAILGVDRERRAYALKFYDLKLDVWTFETSTNYDRVFNNFLRYPHGLARYMQQGISPLRMAQGVYGPEARRIMNESFWQSHLRADLHETVITQLTKSPANTPGSLSKGTVYLSSQFDKFTLSNNIKIRQPLGAWNVDLCVYNFLRKHERRVLGATRNLNEYESHHMTVRIPKQAMERIRRVVHTYYINGPEPAHVYGQTRMRERQWKLGSFKGANQLYTANMKHIPADNLRFEESQRLVEWKRTGPTAALPFVCACGEEDSEDGNEGLGIEVATPDELP
ncbi:hypothetical protein PG991_011984 [Apiospora marii]|uniref:2EXR domain-containing protein n=1 Tax=Apiospora marii TaxID=335849 RepID=A0ABR1RFR9_9PEZI